MSTNIDHTLEVAIGSVLFNVSNFPAKAQSHLWGQDMKPLNDKISAALAPVIRRIQAQAWDEGFDAHDEDWKHHDDHGWGNEECIDATYNPYEDGD